MKATGRLVEIAEMKRVFFLPSDFIVLGDNVILISLINPVSDIFNNLLMSELTAESNNLKSHLNDHSILF